jgi:hypothetical protein
MEGGSIGGDSGTTRPTEIAVGQRPMEKAGLTLTAAPVGVSMNPHSHARPTIMAIGKRAMERAGQALLTAPTLPSLAEQDDANNKNEATAQDGGSTALVLYPQQAGHPLPAIALSESNSNPSNNKNNNTHEGASKATTTIPQSPSPVPPKHGKKKKGSPRAKKEIQSNIVHSSVVNSNVATKNNDIVHGLNEVVGYELSANPLERRFKDPELPSPTQRPAVDYVSSGQSVCNHIVSYFLCIVILVVVQAIQGVV